MNSYSSNSRVTIFVTAGKGSTTPEVLSLSDLGVDPANYTAATANQSIQEKMVELIVENPNLTADALTKLAQASQALDGADPSKLLPAKVVDAVYDRLTTHSLYQGATAEKKLQVKKGDLQISQNPHPTNPDLSTFTITVPSTWGF